MNSVPRWLQRLWAWYFYLVFSLTFLLLYPAFFVLLHVEKFHIYANRLRRFWARLLYFLTGFSASVTFEEPLDKSRPYIFCPNHTSTLDILLFAILYDGDYKFMAKHEFRKIPLFGIFFKTIDIPVERESKLASYRAFKDAIKAIRAGKSLVIFPEGTTSAQAPALVPFKNGPFRLAIQTKTPVVPITFLDNWRLFHYDFNYARPGVTRAIVHKPIDTANMNIKDVDRLKQTVYDTIQNTLNLEYGNQQAIGQTAG